MTTRADLHRLVDALPERALDAAEAFLTFLEERAEESQDRATLPDQDQRADWAAGERRGLDERQRERDANEDDEPSNA
jgi:hypothetical protein